MSCKEGCVVEAPGPGAVLVDLKETATLYKWNSTVVGYLAESGATVLGTRTWWWLAVMTVSSFVPLLL